MLCCKDFAITVYFLFLSFLIDAFDSKEKITKFARFFQEPLKFEINQYVNNISYFGSLHRHRVILYLTHVTVRVLQRGCHNTLLFIQVTLKAYIHRCGICA